MSTEYNGRKPEYKEYAEPNLTRTLSVPSDSVFEAAFYVDASDEIRPPQRFAPHIHDTIEFYVLLDGESSFSVENKVYKLQAGDAVLSRPNELHYCLHDSNARHSHACLWFVPNDRFLFGDFLGSERNHLVPSDADKDELTRILFGLKKAAEDRDKQSQYAYLVYALTLLRTALGIKKADEAGTQPLPPVLSAILDDISDNFREINSLDTLAAKYFVSRSTLSRLFTEYMHVTPKAYVESKRLAHARKLLRNGESVYSAAAGAGFPDCSNFIRLFRTRFGITPARYKSGSTLDFLYDDNVIYDKKHARDESDKRSDLLGVNINSEKN